MATTVSKLAAYPRKRTDTSTGLQPALLADNVDPVTGDICSLFWAPHPVDAAVIFNLSVEQGSGAAVESVGHRYREIRKATDQAPRRIRDEVERPLRAMVQARDIRIEALTSEVREDLGVAELSYVNLRRRVVGQTPTATQVTIT